MSEYSVFLFKQKTAYEMRISDWSSDVCSSDLQAPGRVQLAVAREDGELHAGDPGRCRGGLPWREDRAGSTVNAPAMAVRPARAFAPPACAIKNGGPPIGRAAVCNWSG